MRTAGFRDVPHFADDGALPRADDSAGRTGASLYVGLLGPLQVRVGGRPVDLTAGRLRALLAVLAMSAGRGVPAERLATAVWGAGGPGHPRRSVHTYLTRLRAVLGVDAIHTCPDGYLLDTDHVDAVRFVRLLDAAGAAPDGAAERAHLVEALALWRGTPFEGIGAVWLEQEQAPRLIGRHLDAMERRIDLDLAAGLHGAVVGELRDLTTRYPLRERFWAQLMTGLYRSGRQTEALDTYQRLYRLLAAELGVTPSQAVQDLQCQILAGDIPLDPRAGGEDAPAPVPRQLPADIGHVAGRVESLERLDALVHRVVGAAAISVIVGGPGVGKTTLAVHWAHRVADQFPDGQLYLNLHGFDPSGVPLEPMEALRRLLEALGVPRLRIPADLPARIGLYRSLLADKRALVVLDDARDAEQTRPLLPSASGCVAVVTSRSQLPGLVVEGARPVVLGRLSVDGARDQLADCLGRERIAAEAEATGRLIALCAGLPLALAVVAARARTQSQRGLDALATELEQFPTRLDALDSADPANGIRAVFSSSYSALGLEARRLFRLLSLHPGPDIAVAAAASLAGVSVSEVRPGLAELCQTHLLTEHAPGRFITHGLLREYAAELLREHDSDWLNASRAKPRLDLASAEVGHPI